MKAVVTLGKYFGPKHPRKGQETGFIAKVADGRKVHTCRSNYGYWRAKIEKITATGGVLSVRQWSAKPLGMFDTDKVIVVADVTKQPYLSVARFSGGCRVNGVFYAYVLQRDILVREDWLKAYSAMDYDKFIAAVKTGAKQELPTCRTCKHRQRWELNDHSTKIVQSCALQKSRRTGNGLKRIKVTNPACRLYEKE